MILMHKNIKKMHKRCEVEKLISDITAYLDYIRRDCGLYISIHFSADVLHHLPSAALSQLLAYNSHINPYCIAVKKNAHSRCIAYQKKLIEECRGEGFQSMCHAGVCEYIHPISAEGKNIGFVAVSGYRSLPVAGIDSALWESALQGTEIPVRLCSAILPPLARMLRELFNRYAKEPENEYNMLRQFLHEYHTGITLSDLCRQFGRSKSYISHMFRRESGMTLRAYCNNLKLEDARKLLLETDLPVTEIALDTGFNDVSYFIALFRRKFGMSPLRYRKKEV